MLTCGFVRSKAVASPRAPFRSLLKTCCTGLTPLRWRRAIRVVLSKGVKERVRVDIAIGGFPGREKEEN